ncbi:MAG: zinc ribbon domain-containing protein [Anaerolineae bacterium]|nr:zinc ribbon domain-containing protein [Anaerolineae bacterium]MCX8067819.1 zinc ribbon domain-containing protein [Anaerolineae bacterium]MDW7991687.1 zinc ribbon domain-containing protein [Anaerolineae bacterium]
MPVYEYRCPKCGEKFEKFVRSASAQNEVVCPRCGNAEVEKMVSLFGLTGSARISSGSSCSTGGSL